MLYRTDSSLTAIFIKLFSYLGMPQHIIKLDNVVHGVKKLKLMPVLRH
jgi:hypothetical protein